jgi:ABC-type spermidine/putrescine transport systems, ATPase components
MEIKVSNLTKKYGKTTAVNDFSATFQEGKLIALLGPSGCGKSTMLYMLSGIVPVTLGNIYFDDVDVTYLEPEKREIGLVFQNYALYPHMTVLQNICFPLEIKKIPKEERKKRATEMAKLVHIEDLLDRKPAELSGGQQQRVAIARALIKQPNFLLLDEPLSNLDARLRLEMREEIRRIQLDTGVTTIFVTHDQEEAMSISDQIILMKDGQLMQYESPQELYDNPQNAFVAEFLGSPQINEITGTIQNGRFKVDDMDVIIEGYDCANIPEGKNVTLALRAESMVAVTSGKPAFVGKIMNFYTMGKEELLHIKLGKFELRGYISGEEKRKVDDEIKISLKNKGVFLFDTETGERLQ